MDLGLRSKRVLVTGGSKGIGRACAAALAAEGCTVMLAARDAAALEAAAAEMRERHGAGQELVDAEAHDGVGLPAADFHDGPGARHPARDQRRVARGGLCVAVLVDELHSASISRRSVDGCRSQVLSSGTIAASTASRFSLRAAMVAKRSS